MTICLPPQLLLLNLLRPYLVDHLPPLRVDDPARLARVRIRVRVGVRVRVRVRVTC